MCIDCTIVIREASPSNLWKQRSTSKHSTRFGESYERGGGQIVEAKVIKDTTRKPHSQLTWAQRGSPRQNKQPGRWHGTNLGFLHICHSCVACSFYETPNSGIGDCL